MVASRLSDGQKGEVVARYRAGDSSTELAKVFGCSANTITRVVKAALDPQEYEGLKQRRGARPARSSSPLGSSDAEAAAASDVGADEPGSAGAGSAAGASAAAKGPEASTRSQSAAAEASFEDDSASLQEEAEAPHHRRELAIDDADDFGDDEESDDPDGDDTDGDDADDSEDDEAGSFMAVPVLALEQQAEPVTCRPLAEATLPESAYLLVDKQVELEARPLREFTELGPLPDEEAERQAFMVFVNPRQAKRHCGRNQRVIKLPDTSLLQRTAPFLLAQGISRVVIEGSLFALPGS
ncbi:conserved hypothetical protein [Cyanobium sp. PCC 7001]|nr:conserved hypothetical protein [Cyanobium sp. PCC 7001]